MPYALAAFLGAGLLFSLEPLVGKLVLPRLGGSPAVWNTCLLFFQGMLLAGYAYAHYATRWLGVRRHALLHTALIAVSFITLPINLASNPPVDASPVGWLLATLARSIGLPFFVLSATAPLVQHWLAGTRHSAARDPYFLYAASNLGSLAGLALYPFVLEPLLGLRAQSLGWAIAYVGFAIVIVWLAWRAKSPATPDPAAGHARPIPARVALTWVAIAFVPSALLLTVTGYVTTDIAPMPLLWLAPLALYLATFVVAFGVRGQRAARTVRQVQPALTLAIGVTVLVGFNRLWMLPLHLLMLTIVAYLAHSRLAAERPPAAQLTAFYLWLSVGGTLGGVFGAIIAPVLLMPEVEYALLLTVALLLPGQLGTTEPPRLRRVLVGIAIVSAFGIALGLIDNPAWGGVIAAAAVTTILLQRIDHARVAVAVGVAVLLVVFGVAAREFASWDTIARNRNFFGTLRVRRSADAHRLVHGGIIHGAQLTAPAEAKTLITYYTREGPVGDVFRTLMPDMRAAHVAVVGLGAGNLVCYARPGETWDLFEINPAVVEFATDRRLFTFLELCAPTAKIIVGDGRRALQEMSTAKYDLILLDAFSSDAIPAHLITREAFSLYFERLRPSGFLAVHISNRYLDLVPVVAANAAELGATAIMRNDNTSAPVRRTPSRWVVLARDPKRIEQLARQPEWAALTPERGFRPWTDDYTNLLSVVKAFR